MFCGFPGGAFTDGSLWTLSPKQQGWGRVYQVAKQINAIFYSNNQKCFLMFYPLVRKVLDGKPDGVGYYD